MTLYYEQPKTKIDIPTQKAKLMESFVKHPTRAFLTSVANSYKNRQKTVFSLKLSAFMSLILGISSFSAEAANWYVRPNASTYGTGTGQNWTNAWSGFSNISWTGVACGDTIWVAGGTYTQVLKPNKKCTSSARLSIRRARSDATEATSAAGWTTSFDSSVHQTNGAGIVLNGDWDYITISGRTTSAGGGNGWWIDARGLTSAAGIEFVNGAASDYNVFEYMDLQGPGFVVYTGDGRGIDATPFSTATGNVFSHMKIWGWEAGVYHVGINGSTFEYLDMFDIDASNRATYHPNGIYAASSSNVIVRYSKFHKGSYASTGEGIFFEQSGGSSNWTIYGNLFYDHDWDSGVKALNIASPVPGLKIFNNTFSNVNNVFYKAEVGCGSAETRNNLFYNASPQNCGTMSNNLVLTASGTFNNLSAKDFHIAGTTGTNLPRNAGTNLSAYFKTDMDGNVYGADGAWDIGAYEFSSTGAPPPSVTPITPPSNLTVKP